MADKFILEGMWLHQPETRSYPTLDEAIWAAIIAEDDCSWWPQRLKDEQGNIVLDDDALAAKVESRMRYAGTSMTGIETTEHSS